MRRKYLSKHAPRKHRRRGGSRNTKKSGGESRYPIRDFVGERADSAAGYTATKHLPSLSVKIDPQFGRFASTDTLSEKSGDDS